jgi:hypothetical protein
MDREFIQCGIRGVGDGELEDFSFKFEVPCDVLIAFGKGLRGQRDVAAPFSARGIVLET